MIESCIPKNHKIILVAHDISYVLRALRILGFEFNAFPVSITDISLITSEVLIFWFLTLGELLREIHYPNDRLHSGGNDSNFTLRVLLLLAARACDGEQTAPVSALLDEIARHPIPYRVDQHLRVTRKKAKRFKKKPKKSIETLGPREAAA